MNNIQKYITKIKEAKYDFELMVLIEELITIGRTYEKNRTKQDGIKRL